MCLEEGGGSSPFMFSLDKAAGCGDESARWSRSQGSGRCRAPRAGAVDAGGRPRWKVAVAQFAPREQPSRPRSMLATRRKAAGSPTGKTFDTWDVSASLIPVPTQHAVRTREWIGRKENVCQRRLKSRPITTVEK